MNKKLPLTRREQTVLEYIKDFTTKNEYPPTRREISEACSMTRSGAGYFLLQLEKKGAIVVLSGKGWRNIKVINN